MDSSGFNLCYPLDTAYQINRFRNLWFSGNGVSVVQKSYTPVPTASTSSNAIAVGFSDFCSFLNGREINEIDQLKLSPNPFTSYLKVYLSNNNFGKAIITIRNLTGQVILIKQYDPKNIQLNLEMLSEGMYILNITSENINYNTKIVKY